MSESQLVTEEAKTRRQEESGDKLMKGRWARSRAEELSWLWRMQGTQESQERAGVLRKDRW